MWYNAMTYSMYNMYFATIIIPFLQREGSLVTLCLMFLKRLVSIGDRNHASGSCLFLQPGNVHLLPIPLLLQLSSFVRLSPWMSNIFIQAANIFYIVHKRGPARISIGVPPLVSFLSSVCIVSDNQKQFNEKR